MASNSKKTKRIRARKAKPNSRNTRGDLKRIQENAKVLRKLAETSKG